MCISEMINFLNEKWRIMLQSLQETWNIIL